MQAPVVLATRRQDPHRLGGSLLQHVSWIAFVFLLFGFSISEAKWTDLAHQIGQSEERKRNAVQKLKALPQLREVLIRALETNDRLLALEVISTLQLRDLVPKLLLKIKDDESGFLVLTINSLMDNRNKEKILNTYAKILGKENLSQLAPGNLVALLEPMGRLGRDLSQNQLSKLLDHSYPEVQTAALNYIRRKNKQENQTEPIALLPHYYPKSSYQVRLQMLFLFQEMSRSPGSIVSKAWSQIESLCQNDAKPVVRKKCLEISANKLATR